MPFNRFLSPEYSDGIDNVRRSITGSPLPSARFVSLVVHGSNDDEAPVTMMLALWGQLLDHDLTATAQPRSINGSVPSCCRGGELHPSCLPIKVPLDDPWLSPLGVRCLEFLRSAPAQRRDCLLSWREQTNQATSFIDASPIYASNPRSSDNSRIFRDGLLLFGRGPPQEDVCFRAALANQCIRPGDSRSGEQPGLLSMHMVWVNEHNQIARLLAELNSHWSDEKVYQETRRIIGALFQHITFREFLPLVLGREVCRLFDLELESSGYYSRYDQNVNPTVANEFASSAFRFGHSLIQGSYMRSDRNHRFIPNNVTLHEENSSGDIGGPGSLHRLLRGMVNQRASKRDEFITAELTNHLFQSSQFPFGLDLAAINIQRGRDHGVPAYISWRTPCGLSTIKGWEDLERIVGPRSAQRLQKAYKTVDDIDLFVGGLAERPVVGGLVGPTFACLIAQQFSNLRKGDRFWYENPGFESSFTPAQLESIRHVTFSQVLCRMLGRGTMQPHVFLPADQQENERRLCGQKLLAPIDLSPWTERDPFTKPNDEKTQIKPQLLIATNSLNGQPLQSGNIINKVDFIPNGNVGIQKPQNIQSTSSRPTKVDDKLDFSSSIKPIKQKEPIVTVTSPTIIGTKLDLPTTKRKPSRKPGIKLTALNNTLPKKIKKRQKTNIKRRHDTLQGRETKFYISKDMTNHKSTYGTDNDYDEVDDDYNTDDIPTYWSIGYRPPATTAVPIYNNYYTTVAPNYPDYNTHNGQSYWNIGYQPQNATVVIPTYNFNYYTTQNPSENEFDMDDRPTYWNIGYRPPKPITTTATTPLYKPYYYTTEKPNNLDTRRPFRPARTSTAKTKISDKLSNDYGHLMGTMTVKKTKTTTRRPEGLLLIKNSKPKDKISLHDSSSFSSAFSSDRSSSNSYLPFSILSQSSTFIRQLFNNDYDYDYDTDNKDRNISNFYDVNDDDGYLRPEQTEYIPLKHKKDYETYRNYYGDVDENSYYQTRAKLNDDSGGPNIYAAAYDKYLTMDKYSDMFVHDKYDDNDFGHIKNTDKLIPDFGEGQDEQLNGKLTGFKRIEVTSSGQEINRLAANSDYMTITEQHVEISSYTKPKDTFTDKFSDRKTNRTEDRVNTLADRADSTHTMTEDNLVTDTERTFDKLYETTEKDNNIEEVNLTKRTVGLQNDYNDKISAIGLKSKATSDNLTVINRSTSKITEETKITDNVTYPFNKSLSNSTYPTNTINDKLDNSTVTITGAGILHDKLTDETLTDNKVNFTKHKDENRTDYVTDKLIILTDNKTTDNTEYKENNVYMHSIISENTEKISFKSTERNATSSNQSTDRLIDEKLTNVLTGTKLDNSHTDHMQLTISDKITNSKIIDEDKNNTRIENIVQTDTFRQKTATSTILYEDVIRTLNSKISKNDTVTSTERNEDKLDAASILTDNFKQIDDTYTVTNNFTDATINSDRSNVLIYDTDLRTDQYEKQNLQYEDRQENDEVRQGPNADTKHTDTDKINYGLEQVKATYLDDIRHAQNSDNYDSRQNSKIIDIKRCTFTGEMTKPPENGRLLNDMTRTIFSRHSNIRTRISDKLDMALTKTNDKLTKKMRQDEIASISIVPFVVLTSVERPDNWIMFNAKSKRSPLPKVPSLDADRDSLSELPRPIIVGKMRN